MRSEGRHEKGAAVTVETVLEVLREFEPLQPRGATLGLIAWELFEREESVAPMFARALEEGLIERSGVESDSGEVLWRLTEQGRASLPPLR